MTHRRRIAYIAIAYALALSCAQAARAVVVDWLYEVEVPVETQTAADRQHAARMALREMLTRLTGLRNVPMTEPVIEALRNPERYYVQYRFALSDGEQTQFEVSFEPEAMLDLVARAALPIWSANRPKVIAWLVVDDAGGREVLGAASDHPLAAGLRRRGRERGVEIELPLMDLDDQMLISPAAVWGSFSHSLYEASERYDAELLLIGRASRRATGSWVTAWEFWLDDGEREFSFESDTAEAGAARAVDEVGDELMQRFAVLGRTSDTVDLAVRGASSAGGYAALMRYLAAFEFIDRIDVLGATSEVISIRIVTRSSRGQLGDLLSVDGILQRTNTRTIDLGAALSLTWSGEG